MKLNARQFSTLVKKLIKEEKDSNGIEDLGNRPEVLLDRFPDAYEALPEPYKNDSALDFFIDEYGTLCAQHDLHNEIYVWDNGQWSRGDTETPVRMESKQMKKATLVEVKQIVKEEVQRFMMKRYLVESFKRAMLRETVNFGALKSELESAVDHFKAENPNIKVGNFNWDDVIGKLMNDDESRQMMKVGDADGLANKALDIIGVENPAADLDVEKHVEKNVQSDEWSMDDDELGRAFDNITSKKAS